MPGKAPMPWKTPGGLGGRALQSQNHLPFPKKRIFRLANRKLVESKALSPRSQLQDVTKRFANAREWKKEWMQRVNLIGNVLISVGNYKCSSPTFDH